VSGRRGGSRLGDAVLAGLVLPAVLAGCGGGSKETPSGPSDIAEAQFLLQHNARFNDGRTIRWPNLPIRVFLNNIATADEVTEWARATGGAVAFTFVGSSRGADITFRFGVGDDFCGLTAVEFDSDGVIASADVRLAEQIFRGPQCQRTVVHETGHAIGFMDHTADGGLMDPDGGDGRFTEPVTRMIRNLYSLAPGTFIGSARTPRFEQRVGRRVVTIVDPVRR
jgi:hypothetical protein